MMVLIAFWLLILWLLGYLYQVQQEFLFLFTLAVLVPSLVYLLSTFLKRQRQHQEMTRLLNSTHLETEKIQSPLPKDMEAIIGSFQKMLATHQSAFQQTEKNNQEFYETWIHEIKLPLSTLQLALSAEDPDRMVLNSQLVRMNQLIERMLMYTKQEDYQLDLSIHQNDLNAIVRQSVQKLRPLFIANHIHLELSAIHLKVVTDSKWLGFIINQVLNNAIQYCPSGHIHIYESENELVIEDDGIGIVAEDLPRVFEKGFTGENGHFGQYSSGYGLYLVKKTCDLLNHTVRIESEINKGTKVILHFESKVFFD